MKKSAVWCLLLICCSCIAFTGGFFIGRNGNRSQVQVSTLPAATEFSAGLVNINTATAEQLQTLPGIGTTVAERIVAYRQAHGDFRSVGDLIYVEGIGSELLLKILNLITAGG